MVGKPFHEVTRMLSVNAHGGTLALAATVQPGQTILVVNRSTQEEQEFRVVDVASPQDGKWVVGIEFEHMVDFWKIYFPPLISKQLTDAKD
jgi:hypothetical protein